MLQQADRRGGHKMEILDLIFKVFFEILQSLLRKIWCPSEKSVHGEIVLVTGAGHGMGRLFSMKFADLGAKLVLVDVNEANNIETAEMIKVKCGVQVHRYSCDLRNKEEIKKLAKSVKHEVGDVTILVNNAGVVFNTDLLSLTDNMISSTFDINILSHFWLIREFLPNMKLKNHGHILAMASISGKTAAPYFIDYSSTKHAVVGLMDGLRRELRWQGKSGIKTTYACPTFVKTGFVKNPRTSSQALCPVLEPEKVVDDIMHGMLTDQHCIILPPSAGNALIGFLPDSVVELLFDYINPQTDRMTTMK